MGSGAVLDRQGESQSRMGEVQPVDGPTPIPGGLEVLIRGSAREVVPAAACLGLEELVREPGPQRMVADRIPEHPP